MGEYMQECMRFCTLQYMPGKWYVYGHSLCLRTLRYALFHTVILFHSFVSLLSFVPSQRDVWHRGASRWHWEDGGLLWQPWKFWGAGTDVQHPKGSHYHRHVTRGSVVHGEDACPAGCVVLSCPYNLVNMNHSVTVTWHSDEIPFLKWMQLISYLISSYLSKMPCDVECRCFSSILQFWKSIHIIWYPAVTGHLTEFEQIDVI